MNVKLAMDIQISNKAIRELDKMGYKVVCRALNSQKDEEWVAFALSKGANVFVSPDMDIPAILDRKEADTTWIGLPSGLKSKGQAEYTSKRIDSIIDRRTICARCKGKGFHVHRRIV